MPRYLTTFIESDTILSIFVNGGDGNIEYEYLYLSSYYFYFKSHLN